MERFFKIKRFAGKTVLTALIFMTALLPLTSCGISLEHNSQTADPTEYSENSEILNAPEFFSDPSKGSPYEYTAMNFDKVKAIWFSYIDLSDMLSSGAGSFKNSIETAFNNVKELGINTVYVHVRSFGDSVYESEIFPSSKAFDGIYNTSGGFDALKIMITAAHERGLSIHAWVNPLRLETEQTISQASDCIFSDWYQNNFGEYIVKVDNDEHLWLNPAYSEVRKLIADGVFEITQNYDVDGVHIDDYFYPTADTYFDKKAFELSGETDLADWRRENINKLVSEMYSSVKSGNPSAQFGISPQGNIENDYEKMYADVEFWCENEGFADYILPQIYYGFENPVKPYEETAKEWKEAVKNTNIKLITGLAAYKISINENDGTIIEEEFQNSDKILSRQAEFAFDLGYDGAAVYSYSSLFRTESQKAEEEKEALKDVFE